MESLDLLCIGWRLNIVTCFKGWNVVQMAVCGKTIKSHGVFLPLSVLSFIFYGKPILHPKNIVPPCKISVLWISSSHVRSRFPYPLMPIHLKALDVTLIMFYRKNHIQKYLSLSPLNHRSWHLCMWVYFPNLRDVSQSMSSWKQLIKFWGQCPSYNNSPCILTT